MLDSEVIIGKECVFTEDTGWKRVKSGIVIDKKEDMSSRIIWKIHNVETNKDYYSLACWMKQYMRGVITDKIIKKSKLFLGREITQKELRLYPYIDYSIKNSCQGWSYDKMDLEEIDILNKLYDEKHLIYSPEKVIVSRKFYDFLQDILAESYVDEFI